MPDECQVVLEDWNQVEGHVRAWDFKGQDTLHLVWAVERLTGYERRKAHKGAFNLMCEDNESSAVTCGTSGSGLRIEHMYCRRPYRDERG